jgi:hypothetical protein
MHSDHKRVLNLRGSSGQTTYNESVFAGNNKPIVDNAEKRRMDR